MILMLLAQGITCTVIQQSLSTSASTVSRGKAWHVDGGAERVLAERRGQPTPRRRVHWSGMLHRLAGAGMLQRQSDDSRDRVRRVAVTPSGWNWILENSGEWAFLSLEELLEMPGQGTGDLSGQVMGNSCLSQEYRRNS